MIIDCHTHLGRNDHIKANVNELLQSMDAAKIDKALVFAGELNDCSNDWMLQQIAPHKDRLLGVAAANVIGYPEKYGKNMSDIQKEAVQIAKWYEEGEIVACKFYTGYDHFYPGDRLGEEYLFELEDVGCPAIFHSGDCLNSCKGAKLKYAHPLHIDDVAVDFPKMNFIIAHMGYPWHRDAAQVCFKNQNVFSDISGFVYKNFEGEDLPKFQKTLNEFLDIANSDKLLFGTDWPISSQASYIDALDWVATNTTNKKAREIFSPQNLSQNVKKAFKL
jgi:predicted TIM-barrel fold metal-dependent hydrolase